jgi:hypothetical protein
MTPMTEEEWLACINPARMLNFLHNQMSNRKARLFACACCWQAQDLMVDNRSKTAIEVAEQFADGSATRAELQTASSSARAVLEDIRAASEGLPRDFHTGWFGAYNFANVAGWAACAEDLPNEQSLPSAAGRALCWVAATQVVECFNTGREHANLLRHIRGNPFKPYPAPASWPSTVMQLASSLYDGHDCRLPLSDALEESGHGELAEHFRKEEWHPKGCYAMDLILGKE